MSGSEPLSMSRKAARFILENQGMQNGDRALTGWPAFPGIDPDITATGTSYGAKLLLEVNAREGRQGTVTQAQLLATLLALQCEDGGWAARSQGGVARPEITALVLPVAARLGMETAQLERVAQRLVSMLRDEEDHIGICRVTVLSSAVSCLSQVAPAGGGLRQLAYALASGRLSHPSESSAYWGEELGTGVPSVPHTARAVLALHRARNVLGGEDHLNGVVEKGLAWLRESPDLELVDESLRRSINGRTEPVVIGHFTAAWVLRALLEADARPPCPSSLQEAMRQVLAHEEGGVWRWRNSRDRPIWMTYQGLSAVRLYVLRGLPWPPVTH